jgi:hypothetical protein
LILNLAHRLLYKTVSLQTVGSISKGYIMKFAKQLVALAAVAAAFGAQAESTINTSGLALSATTARLNFSVVIPKIIFLQVGTGPVAPALTANATVDTVTHTVAAASMGDSTAVAGVSSGGATINARVLGNGGNVNFAAVGSGAGLTGPGTTIPWTQIVPSTSGTLIHPVIGAAAVSLAATSGVVNQTTVYSFNYSNSAALAAGTYTGTVTYTATNP